MSARTAASSLPSAVSSGAAEVLSTGSAPATGRYLTTHRAARELGLKRAEFELAAYLGIVRTEPDPGGGGRRVLRREIERPHTQEDFADSVRRRVRTVGTQEAAALLGVPTGRFTRLARLGLVAPVRVYLNRYRAVVWLYLAEELREFTDREDTAALLGGRMPKAVRDQLAAGVDLRPRNWRGRHLGCLLQRTTDPWESAAAVASLLEPDQVTDLVLDPDERAHLDRLRPEPPVRYTPESPAGQVLTGILTAQDPDEIDWLRSELARSLDEARDHCSAPWQAPSTVRPNDPSKESERPADHEDTRPARPREHTARPAFRGLPEDSPGRGRTTPARPHQRRPRGREDTRTPARVPRRRRFLAWLRPGRGA